ncbi:MAG TPA: hypothetical protein DHW63_09920 [Hyphomonadaceae bacterium]|nr:hypothetical protein [Hyphomonadaceae bacterium]
MVDIGIGDVITPGPTELDFPSLLGMATPRLKAYPPETVIAEKLEAMAALGLASSRVKDLYDLWVVEAVSKTFERRGTELTAGRPPMLTPA